MDFKTVPSSPGVYLFKGRPPGGACSERDRRAQDKVLYVGKAVNLKNRLKSYFQGYPSTLLRVSPKVQALLARAEKVEWIETDNEIEALLLEGNLIKEHRPPFNVVLRDDKNYLYLKIALAEDYPRLLFARHIDDPKSKFFGPYTSSRDLRRTISLLKRLFPLCSANYVIHEKDILSGKQKKKPCLNYHLGRCLGPCMGEATSSEYKKVIAEVIRFLEGDYKGVLLRLGDEMEKAAKERKFERAAYLRDQKRSLLHLVEEQKVVLPNAQISRDIFGLARALNQVAVAILVVRQGRLLDQKLVAFEDRFESSEEEILERAIYDFYSRTEDLPKEIVLPAPMGESLMTWLNKKAGSKIKFNTPKYGALKKSIDLASRNATHQLFALSRSLTGENLAEELLALQEILKIKRLSRIEAYDISHLAGTNAVGSMVVFLDGIPAPAHYRRFRIKLAKPSDDFGAILEVLQRRFRTKYRVSDTKLDPSFASCPDLVLIDGGRGQLSTALKALKNPKFKVIALAKKQEEIFLPSKKESIKLAATHPARRLLQRIRDEAHRFAVSYHIKLRRRAVSSVLDEVPGIGAETKKRLLKAFGSVASVKKASVDDISKIVGPSRAKVIKKALE